jgi:hypothetical protein
VLFSAKIKALRPLYFTNLHKYYIYIEGNYAHAFLIKFYTNSQAPKLLHLHFNIIAIIGDLSFTSLSFSGLTGLFHLG